MHFLSLLVLAQAAAQADAVTEVAQTESVLLKILGGALGILTPVLVALVSFAVKYLRAKEAELKAHGERADGMHALTVGAELVQTYVAKAEVEIRPLLQKALADGRLDAAEGAEIKAKVLELIKKEMPGSVMGALSSMLGPAVEGWLSGKVEQAVATQSAIAQAAVPK